MAKKSREEITPELCRQLLDYDPSTGSLWWRKRPPETDLSGFNRRWAGTEAFTALNDEGYRVGHIFDILFRAHRVAFAIVYGRWPDQVDHIDGNKSNNRLANLREVTNQINQRNVRRTRNNTSGYTGVCWITRRRLWKAHIGVDGKQLVLGHFSHKRDAVAARRAAEMKIGFGPIHGT